MCKFSSGNPLAIFLATHLLVCLTKGRKSWWKSPFTQERFMLWECWTNATSLQKFEKAKGKIASRTVALSKTCIHLSFCLWKEMMWNALLVFDSVVSSPLWSQLTIAWLDPPVSHYTVTWMSHAVSSPLLKVLLRPVNRAKMIWRLTLISG